MRKSMVTSSISFQTTLNKDTIDMENAMERSGLSIQMGPLKKASTIMVRKIKSTPTRYN